MGPATFTTPVFASRVMVRSMFMTLIIASILAVHLHHLDLNQVARAAGPARRRQEQVLRYAAIDGIGETRVGGRDRKSAAAGGEGGAGADEAHARQNGIGPPARTDGPANDVEVELHRGERHG